ncbi:phosphate/phosphite/phosphonate ABC transporter substrate-binding protein [Parasutterella sp.]|uniref:phosphate/phosphite/phosphonate ABC transporter substrate-binding protein n=1 Tax=Parasutterella sp. TaxID=2049037 RepID=UPI00352149F7
MSVRQRIKSTAIFKRLLAGFIFISAASFAAEKTEIKVGVIDSFNPEFSTQTLEPTLKFLNSKLPAYRFVPVSLNSVNPDKELKNNPVDFLISSAGTFHELSLSQGIVHVATRKTILSDDPSASEAGAFVTLAKREDLKELRDLKEKVVAASQPNSFDGWLVAQHEIFKNGLDPENFFKRSVFTHFQFPDSLMLLIQGEADVAILSACVLEQLSNEGLIEASDFKVLAQKPQGVLRCARSTDLYPGIVFAAREDIPPKLKWEVTSALMSMPPTNDYEWTIASRFSKVDELYRDLQLVSCNFN